MKYAVISDIHCNDMALKTVLEKIKEQKVDEIICLGDLVGYYTFPNEVIELLIKWQVKCIMGNHDLKYLKDQSPTSVVGQYMQAAIKPVHRAYISQLPFKHTFTLGKAKVLCVHGSPADISEYMYEDDDNTKAIMDKVEADILISGHTHLPVIKSFGSKFYLNPGSVGKPKSGRVESSYLILESIGNTVNMNIEYVVFDNTKLVKSLMDNHFPKQIIESASTGK